MPKPSIHDLAQPPKKFALSAVDSRRGGYKGGRRLAFGARFETWRTTEGYSRREVANRLVEVARKSTVELGPDKTVVFTLEYMEDRVDELAVCRFKPPTWLVLLLIRAFGLSLPWWEFWDGQS